LLASAIRDNQSAVVAGNGVGAKKLMVRTVFFATFFRKVWTALPAKRRGFQKL
jgi:hypothetical protein